MIAVNNRVRKPLTSLFLVSPVSLMASQRAAFGRLLIPTAFRALFCCRSMPSACSGLPEVYLIETAPPCPSSQNTACSIPGSIRACAHECRTAESPDPVYRKPPMESAVPPDDNGQGQIVWWGNTKKCCDKCRPGLEIRLWFPSRSAGALERMSNPFAQPPSLLKTLVGKSCPQDRLLPVAVG